MLFLTSKQQCQKRTEGKKVKKKDKKQTTQTQNNLSYNREHTKCET